MHRTLIGSFFVLGLLTLTGGAALASKTVIKTKGADVSGSFEAQQTTTCAGGATALNTTSVSIGMFESVTTTNGSPATLLQASISVTRFDGCNFVFSFGSGLFQGVGTLSLTALQTGKMTGHFTLDDGTVLDVNLTLTGSDTTTLGTSYRRSILGKVMVVQRSIGTTRTATLSGTVKVDGQTFGTAQMMSSDGQLARNTGGEITIIKP
ncbi:MAG: hypothetical protein ABIS92_18020 [Polyangia bacterium]